ncbi:hypothetical protein ACIQU5_33785 [Streptomyces sp. NPDC090306]|uniref:hypothetical protein n=1 Tax=Streptomyces sp. NPDC090306 TaxID=3365961 RepID=UPI003821154E
MGSRNSELNNVTDAMLVREFLWEIFPDWRQSIVTLEEEEREVFASSLSEPPVGSYGLTSEIFVWKILESLFVGTQVDDLDLASRCATFIDRLLGSERPTIVEMVSIRITDYLLGYPENWSRFQRFAGPLLHQEVDSRRPYFRDS